MTNELKEPGWTPAEIPGLVRKKGRMAAPSPAVPTGNVASPPPAAPVAPVANQSPPKPARQEAPAKEAAPVAEANGAVATARSMAKEALNGAVAFKQETAYLDPEKAHEQLQMLLVNARTLVQKIQAAADSYYIMCDYMAADDTHPYIPVVDSIMRSLQTKDPQLIPELIEEQAKAIVCGWLDMADTANQAVDLCRQLTQASRAETIDEELRQEWNAQTESCTTGK